MDTGCPLGRADTICLLGIVANLLGEDGGLRIDSRAGFTAFFSAPGYRFGKNLQLRQVLVRSVTDFFGNLRVR